MVDPVQSDKAYHNKIDSNNVVQQPWSNEDKDPGNQCDDRRDVGGSEMHDDLRELALGLGFVALSVLHDQMPRPGAQSLPQRNGTFDEEPCLGLVMLTES